MKKRIFNYSFSIIATAILLLSCKENLGLTDIENTDPNSLTINEAKFWFEKNITNKSSARTSDKDDKKPKWDKYYETDMSIGKGIVVSLEFSDPKFPKIVEGDSKVKIKYDRWSLIFSENHLSKLLMYKTKKGEMQTEVITSIPDDDYLAKKLGAIENKDFCGNIIVRDWNGKFLRGYRYKNGKRIANFSDAVKSGRVAIFACGQIDWFSVSCGGGECTTSYMYTETQYCSECCSSDDSTVFPSNSDYNTSGNPNGQAGYTGISTTAAQREEILNNLMSNLPYPHENCTEERNWYRTHFSHALSQKYFTDKVKDASLIYFCDNSQDNDDKNAFQHMYWNALMASAWGHNFAIMLSDMHECPGTGTLGQRNMDLYNNGVGATLGVNNSSLNANSLALKVFLEVKNGQGRRLTTSGNALEQTTGRGECLNN